MKPETKPETKPSAEPPSVHRPVDDDFPPWVPRPSRYRSVVELPPRPEEEDAEILRAYFASMNASADPAAEPGAPPG